MEKLHKIVVKQRSARRKTIGMELHWSAMLEFQLVDALNQSESEYLHF